MTTNPPEDEPSASNTPLEESEGTVNSISESGVTLRRDMEIDLPNPYEDRYLAIRWSEWGALQTDIRRKKRPGYAFLAILWPLFFGMAWSAGLSIIPVIEAKTVLPPWVESFYILGTGFLVVLGVVFTVLDRKMKKLESGKLDDILSNMKRISAAIKRIPSEAEESGQPAD